MQQANCLTAAENQVWLPREPYPDLLELKQSYRLAFAKLIDEFKADPNTADLQLRSLIAQINSIWYARRNQQAALEQQQQANLLALGAQLLGSAQPRIGVTTCTRFGVTINCIETR